MKGFVCAGVLSAIIAAAPVYAVSIDGHQLPEPQWQKKELLSDKTSLQKTQRKPEQSNQTDSLLQRQMRQLEKLRQQAERDRARLEKLKQMQEES